MEFEHNFFIIVVPKVKFEESGQIEPETTLVLLKACHSSY